MAPARVAIADAGDEIVVAAADGQGVAGMAVDVPKRLKPGESVELAVAGGGRVRRIFRLDT
jgi:hypothetical protein